ncbi:hypothetical protein L9F63_004305, partial [Diploptera punctata]
CGTIYRNFSKVSLLCYFFACVVSCEEIFAILHLLFRMDANLLPLFFSIHFFMLSIILHLLLLPCAYIPSFLNTSSNNRFLLTNLLLFVISIIFFVSPTVLMSGILSISLLSINISNPYIVRSPITFNLSTYT